MVNLNTIDFKGEKQRESEGLHREKEKVQHGPSPKEVSQGLPEGAVHHLPEEGEGAAHLRGAERAHHQAHLPLL